MYDLIVIGGGMAGMTSALYAARNNKKVIILEKESVGGQIAKSPKVENYPTQKEISGTELADMVFEQILALDVKFELENVLKISKENNVFTITTDYNTYLAKSVIIATGAKPRMLDLPKESSFIGKGIYYCAICDGPFFSGKEVTLIGDANSALQYALMLSNYCTKVNLITLFDRFFGEKQLIDAVKNTKNIEITHNLKAVALTGEDELEGVVFEKLDSSKILHKTNALFVAIGQVPDNDIFRDLVNLDNNGYIIADENCKTKTDGLFVAGDCRTKLIRQVTTAISDGAVASTNACKYLDTLKD